MVLLLLFVYFCITSTFFHLFSMCAVGCFLLYSLCCCCCCFGCWSSLVQKKSNRTSVSAAVYVFMVCGPSTYMTLAIVVWFYRNTLLIHEHYTFTPALFSYVSVCASARSASLRHACRMSTIRLCVLIIRDICSFCEFSFWPFTSYISFILFSFFFIHFYFDFSLCICSYRIVSA